MMSKMKCFKIFFSGGLTIIFSHIKSSIRNRMAICKFLFDCNDFFKVKTHQLLVGGWLNSNIDNPQYTTHSTQCMLHNAQYTMQHACYTIHSSTQCIVHNEQYTMQHACYTMQSTQCIVHNSQYTMHSTQCIVHNAQYTMHRTQCIVKQCIVHNAQYTMHSTQYTVKYKLLL